MPLTPPKPPTRRYGGKLADPARWQAFRPRVGDIVVCTPPKSGTTWVQGSLALLISGDPEVDANISTNAPWLDISTPDLAKVTATLQAQTHRRQIKTHTPFDGIPIWPDLRYICIYRHPIDVHFSFRTHVENMTQRVLRDVFPPNISKGFRQFVDGTHIDGASLSSIVDHYRSALALSGQENVLRLHYADMHRAPEAAFQRIADHLHITHPPHRFAALFAASTFASMKANAQRFAVAARTGFWRNDADFFDSGTSNKWIDTLNHADLAAYDVRINDLLSPADRHWLEWGDTR